MIFVSFAFYAIKIFLNMNDTAQMGKFASDLQADVESAWQASQSSQEKEYILPKKIEEVCFVDDDYENLEFRATKKHFQGRKINYLDIPTTLGSEDELCFENKDSKITLTIKKSFGESLVIIKK